MKIRFLLVLSLGFFALSSCGGGGGGSVPPTSPPPPPPPGGSDWESGVFLDWSTFQNLCLDPRSGTDSATGQPFPDIQGETLDENNFLRSYSNDTYLWYGEITDQRPSIRIPFIVRGIRFHLAFACIKRYRNKRL